MPIKNHTLDGGTTEFKTDKELTKEREARKKELEEWEDPHKAVTKLNFSKYYYINNTNIHPLKEGLEKVIYQIINNSNRQKQKECLKTLERGVEDITKMVEQFIEGWKKVHENDDEEDNDEEDEE